MMVCPSHECVRLKARTVSSPGRGVPRSVVKLNGSGIGIRWCSTTYLPVSRCQNVSESATSVEKHAIDRIAASATIAGRSQFGRAAGGLEDMSEKFNFSSRAADYSGARSFSTMSSRFRQTIDSPASICAIPRRIDSPNTGPTRSWVRNSKKRWAACIPASGGLCVPAVMLGLMGAGFIVGHPLRGPRLIANQGVEIGDAAGAGGLFGIVFDLLLALRFDAL